MHGASLKFQEYSTVRHGPNTKLKVESPSNTSSMNDDAESLNESKSLNLKKRAIYLNVCSTRQNPEFTKL
jgi:alpha-L-arabinofuranosidase